jgi:two-component system, sporulation sensor kinase D
VSDSIVNDGNYLKIIISNTGKPISASVKESIFDDGFTTKKSGSGIGLYLCKKHLEDMNGSVSLVRSDTTCTEFEIMVSVHDIEKS